LKDYGVVKVGSDQKGDHHVKIKVDIPQKLSKKERQLYEELSKEAKLNIKPQSKGIFS
jgi:molecular chaperone DnaJ